MNALLIIALSVACLVALYLAAAAVNRAVERTQRAVLAVLATAPAGMRTNALAKAVPSGWLIAALKDLEQKQLVQSKPDASYTETVRRLAATLLPAGDTFEQERLALENHAREAERYVRLWTITDRGRYEHARKN